MPHSTEPEMEDTPESHEGMALKIRDHLEPDRKDECGYCGQAFGPDEIVIEKTIHGSKWRFCSEECYRDFKDASDFKDQDLDALEEPEPLEGDEEQDML